MFPLLIKEKNNRLKTGFTTGACAAAAAKAAALTLVQQKRVDRIKIILPCDRDVCFDILRSSFTREYAECSVRKYSGDDPDVTNGAEIDAKVSWIEDNTPDCSISPLIKIEGGEGVGIITKPGLGLEIGSPAINPIPRKMIRYSVEEAIQPSLSSLEIGLNVIISVPDGKDISKRTLNQRLGIINGISILGTTGIVYPYSISAFIRCVIQAIDVAGNTGCSDLIFTTGRRSEKFAQRILDDRSCVHEEAFILVGDFIGVGLKAAADRGIKKVTICGMPGKIFKMAQGKMYTHSKSSRLDIRYLLNIISDIDGVDGIIDKLQDINTARRLYELIIEKDDTQASYIFGEICKKVCQRVSSYVKNRLVIECILTDFDGNILGRSSL